MRARGLWWCCYLAVLAALGCGSTSANLRDWNSVLVPSPEDSAGTFLPQDWTRTVWEYGALQSDTSADADAEFEDSCAAAECAQAGRRPSRRRGGGAPMPRPPALLNPRPTPEEIQARARRAADMAVVLRARQTYYQRLADAQAKYPNAQGYENHHFIPRYMSRVPDGQTYRIPTAYHIAITQAFRARWRYGQPHPTAQELQDILIRVYSEYPIPQLIGIEP